jgi:hypothetical protein
VSNGHRISVPNKVIHRFNNVKYADKASPIAARAGMRSILFCIVELELDWNDTGFANIEQPGWESGVTAAVCGREKRDPATPPLTLLSPPSTKATRGSTPGRLQ